VHDGNTALLVMEAPRHLSTAYLNEIGSNRFVQRAISETTFTIQILREEAQLSNGTQPTRHAADKEWANSRTDSHTHMLVRDWMPRNQRGVACHRRKHRFASKLPRIRRDNARRNQCSDTVEVLAVLCSARNGGNDTGLGTRDARLGQIRISDGIEKHDVAGEVEMHDYTGPARTGPM